MKIDISNYRLYSSEELRSYAEKGLLTFQGADDSLISEATLYMLEGLYTEGELQFMILMKSGELLVFWRSWFE